MLGEAEGPQPQSLLEWPLPGVWYSVFVLAVLEFAVGKRSWARYCVQYFSRAREADAVCSIPCDAHARLRRLDV